MNKRRFLRIMLGAIGIAPVLLAMSQNTDDDVILTHNGMSLRIKGDLSKVRLGRNTDGNVFVITPRESLVSWEES